jgi:hypothetical protein
MWSSLPEDTLAHILRDVPVFDIYTVCKCPSWAHTWTRIFDLVPSLATKYTADTLETVCACLDLLTMTRRLFDDATCLDGDPRYEMLYYIPSRPQAPYRPTLVCDSATFSVQVANVTVHFEEWRKDPGRMDDFLASQLHRPAPSLKTMPSGTVISFIDDTATVKMYIDYTASPIGFRFISSVRASVTNTPQHACGYDERTRSALESIYAPTVYRDSKKFVSRRKAFRAFVVDVMHMLVSSPRFNEWMLGNGLLVPLPFHVDLPAAHA